MTRAPLGQPEGGAAPQADPAAAAPPPNAAARRTGAPAAASVPKMEHVRLTRASAGVLMATEKTRKRLVVAASGFAIVFGMVVVKLALATVVIPVHPKVAAPRREPPPAAVSVPTIPAALDLGLHTGRAMITDRNGEILAVSLPTAALYANPRELSNPPEVLRQLRTVLPKLEEDETLAKLSDTSKQFVYIARQISSRDQLAVNNLGIPGVYFQSTERRRYPLGRVAAQVLGGVDPDGHGVGGGVEKVFEQRLHDDPAPLRLSLDVRVQAVVRDELIHAMEDFSAIAACGIVMDVRTGEVLAMVSLPDYDANDFQGAKVEEQVNRAIGRDYEPGSTFKLQTVSMALDDGVVNIWNGFDATYPIQIGKHTISDFKPKARFLYVPEIIAYSSNIGAARMAEAAGAERQRAWMTKMGMLSRLGFELPSAKPETPPEKNWKLASTLTIGFGQGIAVTPLHVVAGTAAIANGGIYMQPTILAPEDGAAARTGVRVMQQGTSDIVRKLMRVVVTQGFGQAAEVPGYYVGGKTGTAQKTAGGRGYKADARVSAFMGVFPMNAPRYAVYMMLDEPKANASTHGYATAGWVSAPAAGRVIARAAPMLNMLPDVENANAIAQALAIPLQPGRPAGAKAPLQPPPAPVPGNGPAQTVHTGPRAPTPPPVAETPQNVPTLAPQTAPLPRDLRHEAMYTVPGRAAR